MTIGNPIKIVPVGGKQSIPQEANYSCSPSNPHGGSIPGACGVCRYHICLNPRGLRRQVVHPWGLLGQISLLYGFPSHNTPLHPTSHCVFRRWESFPYPSFPSRLTGTLQQSCTRSWNLSLPSACPSSSRRPVLACSEKTRRCLLWLTHTQECWWNKMQYHHIIAFNASSFEVSIMLAWRGQGERKNWCYSFRGESSIWVILYVWYSCGHNRAVFRREKATQRTKMCPYVC